jgi:succinate dehydrogenase / fumarate reductase membrane anchor subunit
VRAAIAQPLTATLLAAFVLSLFWHARLGLQVVVEDYVHGAAEVALQVLIKFIYALAAIAALLAIGRIVFTA